MVWGGIGFMKYGVWKRIDACGGIDLWEFMEKN